MNTVAFMGANYPTSYIVADEVAAELLKRASANKDGASKYVNEFLKWALENYPAEKPVEVEVKGS
jgi:hypothetical protein